MQPRVDFISLGVRSVDASRRFYAEGLGWPVHREMPGDVVFIQVNHGLILSLWDAGQMHAEAGVGAPGPVPCITLSHNLPSTEDGGPGDGRSPAAGAEIVAEPVTQPWGGYSGYFADPDGFRWEVAYNPTWAVDDDGKVTV